MLTPLNILIMPKHNLPKEKLDCGPPPLPADITPRRFSRNTRAVYWKSPTGAKTRTAAEMRRQRIRAH